MPRIDLKKNINVGEYVHKIDIQRRVKDAVDNYGLPTEEWKSIYKTRAKIVNQNGKEYLEQGVSPYSRRVIKLWFRSHPRIKIDPHDRLVYDGQIWNIRSVDDANENRIITVLIAELAD